MQIDNLILLAPDIDSGVISQRVVSEAMTFFMDRVTIYVSDQDGALAISNQLYASAERLGGYAPSEVTERQKETLERLKNVDVIFYSGDEGGLLEHSYYRAPAILADIFLLLDGCLPGASNGRPLEPLDNFMWEIDDNYFQ